MEIRYYKGRHKVKVVTKSVGYLTIEALEDFEDLVEGERIRVRAGERRIVPINAVSHQKKLTLSVKEHAYELEMEEKLKRLVAEDEKSGNSSEKQI